MRRRLGLVLLLSLAVAACAGVLGIRDQPPSHPFEHRAHVLAGVNCKECHAEVERAGENGPLHLPSTEICLRCHQQPHDQRACAGCHGEPQVRGGAALAREHLRFEHREHQRATRGDCVRCHLEVAEPNPVQLRPTMATCFGCHEHQNQWQSRDCDGCHVDLADEHALPSTHVVHDGDWLREHGLKASGARDLCSACHSERQCSSCHGATTAALSSRLAFDAIPTVGLHRAGFRSRHALEARADPGLCTTCHSESSCSGCHAAQSLTPGGGSKSPHARGWITTARGGGEHGIQARIDPGSCIACHGGAGERLCVSCHSVGGPGGNPHGPGFASTKDKLRDLPCRLCHAGGL